jgi:excisionase family DNA binding protein
MTADPPRPGERRLELTISQVALRLGVSVGTIRRWADAGHLRAYRTPGGQRRFSVDEVDAFLATLERRRERR